MTDRELWALKVVMDACPESQSVDLKLFPRQKKILAQCTRPSDMAIEHLDSRRREDYQAALVQKSAFHFEMAESSKLESSVRKVFGDRADAPDDGILFPPEPRPSSTPKTLLRPPIVDLEEELPTACKQMMFWHRRVLALEATQQSRHKYSGMGFK